MPAFTWPQNVDDALREQFTLRDLVSLETSLTKPFRFKQGIAIGSSYDDATKTACAAGVLFDSDGNCSPNIFSTTVETDFPYISGLLAFRVGPAICGILDEVIDDVEIMLLDGQGIAHPRRFGLASHIGVLYDKPSIGLTKTGLYGTKDIRLPQTRFDQSVIKHPKSNVPIGYVVSLGDSFAPCFVSPGHRMSATDSVEIIKQIFGRPSWYPTALRRAHAKANTMAKTLNPKILG